MKTRIITAIVALAVFVPFLVIGGNAFQALMYIITTIAIGEVIRMQKRSLVAIDSILLFLLGWVILLPNEAVTYLADYNISFILIVSVIVMLNLTASVLSADKVNVAQAALGIILTLYIAAGFRSFLTIRNESLNLIVFAILIVILTDSFAYFVGRKFGKTKLAPTISPNKTIEGSIGGTLIATIVAVAYTLIFPIDVGLIHIIIGTIVLSIVGQCGDLVESAVKRYCDVKDSGKILPGHGGLYDRFDSWLFVFPMMIILQFM
ncbi:phosphatidate cytidylyltransferase [Brochothrix campestris]|uniref:Phosphatidate cytidylyltransferase n=1 Tax=Brochothrix campestris FSL F6-1037 TaxID=1265861 RepID=W7CWM8_9LIST|nr:phosphatidate cytidylyltransferase [Brochothrix campestris]EUJ41150.1 CDP-diglyceride synthetase [Brochothrix campestris FSL F6-1037]